MNHMIERHIYFCIIWSWHSVPFGVMNLTQPNKVLITLFKFIWNLPCLMRGKQEIIETRVCWCQLANDKGNPSLYYTKKNGKLACLWCLSCHWEGGKYTTSQTDFSFFFLSPDEYSTCYLSMRMDWHLVDNQVFDIFATNCTVEMSKLHNNGTWEGSI